MNIEARGLDFAALNEKIRGSAESDIDITGCMGQRYIGAGLAGRRITIHGTPGNALGAYLDGSDIVVRGNAQDATGDTMNGGTITIYGNAGDATGYSMRGGGIYIRGNCGYRTGIHMKAYQEQQPLIIVGGKVGSFLGEYQAGGAIIVLDLPLPAYMKHKPSTTDLVPHGITGFFCGTGMHGGAIYLRASKPPKLPSQVKSALEKGRDIPEIAPIIGEFCERFNDVDKEEILSSDFCILTANTKNPYTQMYTHN